MGDVGGGSDTIISTRSPRPRAASDAKARAVRTLRRPITLAAAVAAAALALGGCSDTNFGAQTNQQYQPAVGANHRGDVNVLNTLLVANGNGSATVSAGVVNTTDDTDAITGITATTLGGDQLRVTGPESDVAIDPETNVALGRTGEEAVFVVADAPVGQYVRLTVTFETAQPATIEAPVVTRTEAYADVATG
jgi:hypothetical protein